MPCSRLQHLVPQARDRNQTPQSGDRGPNHEATMPPTKTLLAVDIKHDTCKLLTQIANQNGDGY